MTDHDRSERLAEYIAGVGADARFWPNDHCLLYLGRWVAVIRPGFDVTPFEGRVTGRIAAHKLLLAAGGVDALLEGEAEKAGLERVAPSDARVGAIGLIRVPRVNRPGELIFGCIRTARRWAIRSIDGVVSLSVETIKVQPHQVWNV